MWKQIAIVAASALVLTACAEPVKTSGFLSNYSQLTPDPKIEGALSYRGANLYSYRKFLFDPMVVHFAPKAKGSAIEPASLKELTGAGLGGASMEAEAVDSQTGKRVAAVMETESGKRLSIAAGFS